MPSSMFKQMGSVVKSYIDTAKADLQTQMSNYIATSQKGANNGVATLNSTGKLEASQFPSNMMPYDIIVSTFGKNTNSESIFRMKTARTFTIPANFTGSVLSAGTAATSSATYIVKKNGTQVATFNFGAGATTGTFSTPSGSITCFIGDKLEIVAPATADSTLADIDLTILTTLD